jgi:hypothetical protein
MLEKFVYPQLQELWHGVFSQQDGAPPHCTLIVHVSLNQYFPNQWIGHAGPIWHITLLFFPVGIHNRLCLPDSGGQLK